MSQKVPENLVLKFDIARVDADESPDEVSDQLPKETIADDFDATAPILGGQLMAQLSQFPGVCIFDGGHDDDDQTATLADDLIGDLF